MRSWIIDAAALPDKAALHAWAAAALPLPSYYGGNLDALYDCLSSLGSDTAVTVQNAAELPRRFGKWGQSVLRLLARAGAENPHLTVRIEDQ